MAFLLEGYDHLLDIEDDEDKHILDVAQQRNQQDTFNFLNSIPAFEVRIYFFYERYSIKTKPIVYILRINYHLDPSYVKRWICSKSPMSPFVIQYITFSIFGEHFQDHLLSLSTKD